MCRKKNSKNLLKRSRIILINDRTTSLFLRYWWIKMLRQILSRSPLLLDLAQIALSLQTRTLPFHRSAVKKIRSIDSLIDTRWCRDDRDATDRVAKRTVRTVDGLRATESDNSTINLKLITVTVAHANNNNYVPNMVIELAT